MRKKNGQFTKGYSGNPLGRPKMADESFLVDLWNSEGQKFFAKSIRGGERWALKILMDKLFSNKKHSESSFKEGVFIKLDPKKYKEINEALDDVLI